MRLKYSLLFIALTMFFTGESRLAFGEEKPFVIIGTGPVTGVYYSAGHAVAKVFDRVSEGANFRVDAESSQGAIDNINNVLSGKWQFGIAPADILDMANRGVGPWMDQPHDNLRVVAGLHLEALTIMVNADRGIASIEDLRGKTIGIDSLEASNELNIKNILLQHGIDAEKDLQLVLISVVDAPGQLQKGRLDGFIITVGHPNYSVREATFGERNVRILQLNDEIAVRDIQNARFLEKIDIAVDFYPRLENEVPISTVGVRAVLFTVADTSAEQVKGILLPLINDLPRFKRQHPAFSNLTTNDLPYNLVIPLHPAAFSVYQQEGIIQ